MPATGSPAASNTGAPEAVNAGAHRLVVDAVAALAGAAQLDQQFVDAARRAVHTRQLGAGEQLAHRRAGVEGEHRLAGGGQVRGRRMPT